MATGPEHYRDAERAFENAKQYGPGSQQERFQLDAAQYHATMALAAATALQAALPLIGDDEQITDWSCAIGVTFTPADAVRVHDTLVLLDQLGEEGLIVPAASERLREVLGKPAKPSATEAAPAEPPAEAVEEIVELMYQAGVLDGSEWAADRAAGIARALLKAGVRLPAEMGGA